MIAWSDPAGPRQAGAGRRVVKSDQNARRLAKFAGYTDGLQVVAGKAVAHICRNGSCIDATGEKQALLDYVLGPAKS